MTKNMLQNKRCLVVKVVFMGEPCERFFTALKIINETPANGYIPIMDILGQDWIVLQDASLRMRNENPHKLAKINIEYMVKGGDMKFKIRRIADFPWDKNWEKQNHRHSLSLYVALYLFVSLETHEIDDFFASLCVSPSLSCFSG